MSVTIEVEFTDAQWALVQAHYPNDVSDPDSGIRKHRDITNDELKAIMFDRVKAEVAECLRNAARAEADVTIENCFDV
tara:strand:- start:505 stop:738 length:234 start_codon:yes stop_codon:yes gene_type:complete